MKTSPVKNCETACGQRYVADVRVAQHPVRRRRVVEHRLHLVLEVVPGAGRILVDRRAGRELDVLPRPEERREPLDEVADDVAGGPVVDRGRRRPTGRPALRSHNVAEPAGDLTELLGRGLGHGGSTALLGLTHRFVPALDGAAVMNRQTRPCAEEHDEDQQDRLDLDAVRLKSGRSRGPRPTTAMRA